MEQQYITSGEFLGITLFLGCPIFILGAIVQFVFLRKLSHPHRHFFLPILTITFVLEVGMAILLWVATGWLNINLPEKAFMLFGFINLYALLSALVIVPCATLLYLRKYSVSKTAAF